MSSGWVSKTVRGKRSTSSPCGIWRTSGLGRVHELGAALPVGVELLHKMDHGAVDLQIAGWGDRLGELQVLLGEVLRSDMSILETGKSASLRLHVPPLRVADGFADQAPSVQDALDAAVELLDWSKTLPDLSR